MWTEKLTIHEGLEKEARLSCWKGLQLFFWPCFMPLWFKVIRSRKKWNWSTSSPLLSVRIKSFGNRQKWKIWDKYSRWKLIWHLSQFKIKRSLKFLNFFCREFRQNSCDWFYSHLRKRLHDFRSAKVIKSVGFNSKIQWKILLEMKGLIQIRRDYLCQWVWKNAIIFIWILNIFVMVGNSCWFVLRLENDEQCDDSRIYQNIKYWVFLQSRNAIVSFLHWNCLHE